MLGYLRSGSQHKVRMLVDQMKDKNIPRNAKTYSILLQSFIEKAEVDKIGKILEEMQDDEIHPATTVTNAQLLQAFIVKKEIKAAKKFYDSFKDEFQDTSPVAFFLMINALIQNDDIESAYTMIEEAKIKYPSYLTERIFGMIISGYTNKNQERLLELYNTMKELDLIPSLFTYNVILNYAVQINDRNLVYEILSGMQKREIEPSSVTIGTLMAFFAKERNFIEMEKIVNSKTMPSDEYVYHTLANAYLEEKRFHDFSRVFDIMKANGVEKSIVSYNIFLSFHGEQKNIPKLLKTYNFIKAHLKPDSVTFSTTINYLSQNNKISKCFTVLSECKKYLANDVISPSVYNPILYYYATKNDIIKVLHEFETMKNDNILPNNISYNAILHCYRNIGDIDNIVKTIETMKSNNLSIGSDSYSILIRAYLDKKLISKAEDIFNFLIGQNLDISDKIFGAFIFGIVKVNPANTVKLISKYFNWFKKYTENKIPSATLYYYVLCAYVNRKDKTLYLDIINEMKNNQICLDPKQFIEIYKKVLQRFDFNDCALPLLDTLLYLTEDSQDLRKRLVQISNHHKRGPEVLQILRKTSKQPFVF